MMVTLRRPFWFLLFSFAFLFHVSLADDPRVTVSKFKNLPTQLSYFEDSEVVVYHDAMDGNVWRSGNEGKDWQRVGDVPEGEAMLFFLHPFSPRAAFVLTKGTKHYLTNDRGNSWQSFEVPIPPAMVSDPLSFHSDPKNAGYVLFQGMRCESGGWWGGKLCHDETYYTTDDFAHTELLLGPTRSCRFAHSSKDFKHSAHKDLIFCVGWDTTSSDGTPRSSKLFTSTDFFRSEKRAVSFPGGNRGSDGVVAFAIVSKFAVAAVKDMSQGSVDEMLLFVSANAETWAKGHFPHASSSKLRENTYTVVESKMHSLGVDVLLHSRSKIGTLFVSNSNGTYFVQSLQNTNRNSAGFVDYENIYGVESVGIANIVNNADEVDERNAEQLVKSLITFDDGSNWTPIPAPSMDHLGNAIGCDVTHPTTCSLNLHSVTSRYNFGRVFSSPAPGYVLGVGNVGEFLLPYKDCDTFISTEAGREWRMVRKGAHKYAFGDQGSIMVIVDDEPSVDHVSYSYDSGKTWQDLKLDASLRARMLMTAPDSTSQKFLLVGTLAKANQTKGAGKGRHAAVFLDFTPLRKPKCRDGQFEKWYARTTKGKECIMGHKQWYIRKQPDAECFVGNKFRDPVEHEENCPCGFDDYECDFNYVKLGDSCVPQGPEQIPAGVCKDTSPDNTYLVSSGYRLIPGNTCDKSHGLKKDEPERKNCSQAELAEGEIAHQTFEFPAPLVQQEYFKESQTILVRLSDGTIWQSSNEGYTWKQLYKYERFLAFYIHRYAAYRAYLVTNTQKVFFTVDTGKTWQTIGVPLPANTLGIPMMSFHPLHSDWLIWVGGTPGCSDFRPDCHTEAWYTTDHGKDRTWHHMESYVKSCAWARDTDLKVDSQLVICESYRDKKGSQRFFGMNNPVELWVGTKFYKEKKKLFDNVVGFAKFSKYLVVAEVQPEKKALDLQFSLDGTTFASGLFPPSMRPDNHAYTILESSTDSVFLHLTMSDRHGAEFGNILKSNSNGTFYGISIENVNRNAAGYIDFEKMINIDGIAVVNIVVNHNEAELTGHKELQSRITHNGGGRWKSLVPPRTDANKQPYACTSTVCALHIHGYKERWDPRATYSTPSVPGLMMAVGNVGERLAPYTDSDTFLTRDAGFTWEEVHKGAHLWQFGDSGSVLVMASDEEATDHIVFSTDEGMNWREYNFGDKMRVKSIVTMPSDTSRKFIMFGYYPQSMDKAVAVHIDFSSLTRTRCVLSIDDPANDDFELWSPSEEREEQCLFGRKTLFYRRIRDRNCYVGDQPKVPARVVSNCTCTPTDFECEFNYVRNSAGQCVLGDETTPVPSDDDVCRTGAEYWYERTAYRQIPHSSCVSGNRPDRGTKHICPGPLAHGEALWFGVLASPFAFTALAAWWYTRKSGLARGTIRLPDNPADSGVPAMTALALV